MRVFVRSLITVSAAGLLAGCAGQAPTQWMPHGYKYDDNTPITSPAPSKPWLEDAVIHDTEKLSSSTAAWQGAVYELVDKIAPALPGPETSLALKTRAPATTQKQALDHYLRQVLLQRGYRIVPETKGVTILTYDVMSLENPDAKAWAVRKLGAPAVPGTSVRGSTMKDMYLLRATLTNPVGRALGDEAVVAVLTGEKAVYRRWPGYANQPVQGETLTKRPVYDTRD